MKFQRLALVGGLLLFLWLLRRIGLGVIARSLNQVGWGFAAILALESVVVVLATLGWRQTLPPDRRVPFGSLLAIRLAGDSVNALAPAAVVGGELVKAGLLSRYVPGTEALGSVGLAAMTQFLAQVFFVGFGALLVRSAALQPRLRLLGLALLAFLIIFAAALSWVSRPRRASSGRMAGARAWLVRLLAGRAAAESFLRDLGGQVFGAVRERPGKLTFSSVFFLGAWLVNVAEVGLALLFLGAPVPAAAAFSIAVLLVFVEGALFFVPARLGVQEGGLYAIFLALGLDPVRGFALGLVRRLRELTWGLAGLVLLGLMRRRGGKASAVEPRALPSQPPLGSSPVPR